MVRRCGSNNDGDHAVLDPDMPVGQRQAIHHLIGLVVQVVGNRIDEPAGERFDVHQGPARCRVLHQREQHEPF